jgi:predicted outer membrane repeat protein
LTLIGGLGAQNGGSIQNNGTLHVSRVFFSNNVSNQTGLLPSAGGAIQSAGSLTVSDSSFTQNTAGSGGAISSSGPLAISGSQFSSNSQGTLVTLAHGSVDSSTFYQNSTTGIGSAIQVVLGDLTVTNCTIANNSAPAPGQYSGWAISAGDILGSGIITLTNSTVAYNDGGPLHGWRMALANTLVAASTSGDNCEAVPANLSHNIDDGITCAFGSANGSQSNLDPKIGVLDYNGGSVFTIALLPGSPAINHGSDAYCPPVDEVGTPRPQIVHCDVGALEWPGNKLYLPVIRR